MQILRDKKRQTQSRLKVCRPTKSAVTRDENLSLASSLSDAWTNREGLNLWGLAT